MKLVVADASPIHYLVLVGAVHVLPKLFARVQCRYSLRPKFEAARGAAPGRGPLSAWAAVVESEPRHPASERFFRAPKALAPPGFVRGFPARF